MNSAFLYCWTDSQTNMLYVGYHKGSENDGYVCSSKHMLAEYNKRPHDFTRQIIARGDVKDIISLETSILKLVNASKDDKFYNKHNNNGVYSESGHSDETKSKISQSRIGMARTLESRKKQSETVSGKNNHFYGKTHSDEKKQKHSEFMKGRFAGSKHPCATPVKYNGIVYGTLKEMSAKTGLTISIVRKLVSTGEAEKI